MEHGVQCVMTIGALRMQMLCADNLDLRELSLPFVSDKPNPILMYVLNHKPSYFPFFVKK